MSSSSNNNNEKITPVYIKSKDHTWVPALQLKTFSGKAVVAVPKFKNEQQMLNCGKASKTYKYHDNQIVDLSEYPNNVLPMQNTDANGNLEDYKDMVDLPFMHEAAILYNLKLRHIREKPYTRTGDIVIAVNPYKWLHELYTEEKRCYFSNRLVWEQSEEDPRAIMEPHVYEVSSLAYKGLALGEHEDQSILVSGESGAGKTETVKILLNHIASVQRGQAPPGYFQDTEHDPVVKRVVESNPLLEAFGNAKTRRNDNSSRFGKYLQLQFQPGKKSETLVLKSANCSLVGSKCDVYLLEKNRVIAHDAQERNFHIFYQLLAARDEVKAQFWEGLRGTTNESFKFVGPTKTNTIEGMHDADRFQETLNALALVGVTGEQLTTLMQALCIVLQLGNVGFQAFRGDTDKSAVATMGELKALSQLMGVSENDLAISFNERTFTTGRESHKVHLSPDAAKEACEALAKEAYQKAFLWLVNKINEATCADETIGQKYGTIGLLDIFGFEAFPHNRFEQLCINYANEKLQQKFNEDIFKNVQAEYKAEGISLEDIRFDDNTDVLDLIEGRTGLLNLLNEECIRPRGNDMDYVHKSLRVNKESPTLIVHKTDRLSFGIQHYAGQVMYDAEGFVNKNLDTLPTDLQSCAEKCSNAIIKQPRSDENVGTKKVGQKHSNITAPTIWTKYKSQLNDLMTNLRKTKSRYIRCIKPNSDKAPGLMEHAATVDQLRCAGVVAGITIARSAFPNRLPNSVVLARFGHMWDTKLNPSKRSSNMTLVQKRQADCKALLEGALKSKECKDENGNIVKAFAVGKTKTFFRSGALEFLEAGRMRGMDNHATIIQRAARRWLALNAGRHDRQLREMEEARRALLRKEEEERRAKLAKERKARRDARMKGLKKMENDLIKFEKAVLKYGEKQEEKLREANRLNKEAREQLARDEARLKREREEIMQKLVIEKVEVDRLVDENSKLIDYLKKENKRSRKEYLKAQKKYEALAEVHANNQSDYETIQEKIIDAKSFHTNLDKLRMAINTAKAENRYLSNSLTKHQDMYLEQARARLELQKIMANLLTKVQESLQNRSLVEETVVTALKAESLSKSVMAALDIVSLEPDLTCSDVSECDSESSDWFF